MPVSIPGYPSAGHGEPDEPNIAVTVPWGFRGDQLKTCRMRAFIWQLLFLAALEFGSRWSARLDGKSPTKSSHDGPEIKPRKRLIHVSHHSLFPQDWMLKWLTTRSKNILAFSIEWFKNTHLKHSELTARDKYTWRTHAESAYGKITITWAKIVLYRLKRWPQLTQPHALISLFRLLPTCTSFPTDNSHWIRIVLLGTCSNLNRERPCRKNPKQNITDHIVS
jgi:hypothetical protein